MIGIRHEDDAAWCRFLREYTEPAMSCLRAFGLKDQDAEDVWQDVLLRHNSWVYSYDPAQGKFRTLLYQEIEYRFFDWHRMTQAKKRDIRKKVEADAPVRAEEPDGETLKDQLENAEARQRTESIRNLMEQLEWQLRDYPDEEDKQLYLEWLCIYGGTGQKAFAASKGIPFDKFRYLRERILKYLDPQWRDLKKNRKDKAS